MPGWTAWRAGLKMMKGNRKGFLQLALMLVISVLTQGIVLGRAAAVAGLFGTGGPIDSFNAVHSIAGFLFSFISTGITAVLIPAYMQKKPGQTIQAFITILYGFGILAIAVSWLLRKPLLGLFSAGQAGFMETGLQVFFITMVSQFFNTQMGIYAAFCQVKDYYNIPKLCTLIANGVLLGLLIVYPESTVFDYAVFTALTTTGNALGQWLIARHLGYKFHITFLWDTSVRNMMKVFLPTVFSAGLYQINLLTDAFISARLGEGQITILTFANQMVNMVNALLVTNILTFLFPKIAAGFNRDMKVQQKQLFGFIYFGETIMALLAAGFLAVGIPAVNLLFSHGNFTSQDSQQVFICISIYMLGFPINIIRDLFYRFFYAKGNTRATFYNSVTASIFNFIVSIILAQFIGIYGVILGTVLTSLVSCSMICIRFNRVYGHTYSLGIFLRENIKIVLAIVSSLLSVQLLQWLYPLQAWSAILVYGIICVMVYGLVIWLLKGKGLQIHLNQ